MTTSHTSGANWQLYNGDCVEVLQKMPDACIDYSIFSPPFESLYTYSDNPKDMSNCQDSKTFWKHFDFLINQLQRVIKPGRLITIHCMQIPTSKTNHGYIGLRDFRGEIIRHFEANKFIYHSEVCIRKDPVMAMQRTKALGLLHKQLKKDSSMSRQGIADYMVNMLSVGYLVTGRKRGDNTAPVKGRLSDYYGNDMSNEDFDKRLKSTGKGNNLSARSFRAGREREEHKSIEIWQRYAEPVWMDINQTDTLSKKLAREEADERHIAPLQLTPIRRCVQLWTNEGEVVLTPFAGIGSELYAAVGMNRKAIGIELKPSYYKQAIDNLKSLKRNKGFTDHA